MYLPYSRYCGLSSFLFHNYFWQFRSEKIAIEILRLSIYAKLWIFLFLDV